MSNKVHISQTGEPRPFKIGMVFYNNRIGGFYLLCGYAEHVWLVALKSGDTVTGAPTKVSNPHDISGDEWNCICGREPDDFDLLAESTELLLKFDYSND